MERKIYLERWRKRRHEIYAYKQEHSYFETALHFGVTPTAIVSAVKQVKHEIATGQR